MVRPQVTEVSGSTTAASNVSSSSSLWRVLYESDESLGWVTTPKSVDDSPLTFETEVDGRLQDLSRRADFRLLTGDLQVGARRTKVERHDYGVN